MLIIERKAGQRIIIHDAKGNELVIEVSKLRPGRVTLSFAADDQKFDIWREEVPMSPSDNEPEVEEDGTQVPTHDGWKGLDYSAPKKENKE